MKFVAEQSVLWAAVFGAAALTLVIAGVTLHIDREMEVFFIQVDPEHSRPALKTIGKFADALGFEVMAEWECPSEEMPNGALRHWMAEKKEVARDSSSVQAV